MAAKRPLMVLGCTSGAGKSLMVTALARWWARRGVDVVPFKAQNMSNNARVVEGGEIGVAQWLQARAAGVEPSVDMNPVLLKPEADTRSQVVMAGKPRPDLTEMPWRDRGPHVWPAMEAGFDCLRSQHDLVIIEGAGSPAEINLPDLVNNRLLAHADAAAILVADIDRGGAFAHLYGTWALVPDSTRKRLAGYVLNRFRGDPGLLAPGPDDLTALTSMPCAGVLPMLDHRLPDEEGATIRGAPAHPAMRVAVVRAPYASNLDEFHLLAHAAEMRWATTPADLEDADLVVLPGSKHVSADAAWLFESGLGDSIALRARIGGKILGVCGGAMLLGGQVADVHGVEGPTEGLGVLPFTTTMDPDKTTTAVTLALERLDEPWRSLNGLRVRGYEIRHGHIEGDGCRVAPRLWADGSVLATTVHGLLEDPAVLETLTGRRVEPVLEHTFELLADAVEEHLDTRLIEEMVLG